MQMYIDKKFEKYYKAFPIAFLDIGGYGGLPKRWKVVRKFLNVIAFEPDQKSAQDLHDFKSADRSIKYIKTALFNEKTRIDFNITRGRGISSVYTPNRKLLDNFPESERFDIVETVKIDTDTLDNMRSRGDIRDIDFIKLDTQGCELRILEGGKNLLDASLFGLEVEVEFLPVYENQPLFTEIDSFLKKFDFQLFDIRPHYWKRNIGSRYGGPKGQVVFADTLYLKDSGEFIKGVSILKNEDEKKSKLVRAIAICLLYGYVDYALELLQKSQAAGIINSGERSILDSALKKNITLFGAIPYFRGKSAMAKILYRLYKLFQVGYRGWALGGEPLGNRYIDD